MSSSRPEAKTTVRADEGGCERKRNNGESEAAQDLRKWAAMLMKLPKRQSHREVVTQSYGPPR